MENNSNRSLTTTISRITLMARLDGIRRESEKDYSRDR